jgi:predicted site-specific integrase-resolvase
MIDKICFLCGEYVSDVYTVRIKDDKEAVEYSGHNQCVTDLHNQINGIKNLDKKSVQQVLKEIKFSRK